LAIGPTDFGVRAKKDYGETIKLGELPILQNIVDEIVFVKRMPLEKGLNAKIDYCELRKLLESRVDELWSPMR